MEKSLKLKGTDDTPEVMLDRESGVFKLSGRSLPEEAFEFYKPIIAWIKSYIKNPNASTEFQIEFDYFNSSSVKQVLDILMLLEEGVKAGKKIKVIWWYDEGDELMEIKGKEFQVMLTTPFELKQNG